MVFVQVARYQAKGGFGVSAHDLIGVANCEDQFRYHFQVIAPSENLGRDASSFPVFGPEQPSEAIELILPAGGVRGEHDFFGDELVVTLGGFIVLEHFECIIDAGSFRLRHGFAIDLGDGHQIFRQFRPTTDNPFLHLTDRFLGASDQE